MTDTQNAFKLLVMRARQSSGREVMILDDAWSEEHGGLLLGADHRDARHVLVPLPTDFAWTPTKGVSLELTSWTDHRSGTQYLDLVCLEAAHGKAFSKLVDDLMERIREGGVEPHRALLTTLGDWRRLLRPSRHLTEEKAMGIFGELLVLRELARINPFRAVEAWVGPEGLSHDFVTAHGEVEVKTTKQSGRSVSISSLDQLEPASGAPLILLRQEIQVSPNGRNVTDLVDELERLGCLREEIVDRLAEVDFMLGVDDDPHRFVVAEAPVAWRVGPDFPGIRRGDLPAERSAPIERIQYSVNLLGAPGEMTEEELASFWQELMSS